MPLFLSTTDDQAVQAMLAGDSDMELFKYISERRQVDEVDMIKKVKTLSGREYIELRGSELRIALNDFRIQPMIERHFLSRFVG